MEQLDFLIIGGGVVGLAVTAKLAECYENGTVALMERHTKFGQETSSRNSEVIHSGIYYPTASLKARLCVEGRELLYEFCENNKVPYQRMGKLIIARNESEIAILEAFMSKGAENGVNDLVLLDGKQVAELEPNIKAKAAILSPSTGIVDSHSLMARLEARARKGNALMAYGHEVCGIDRVKDGYRVHYRFVGGEGDIIGCRWIINCAGLNSGKIAAMVGIDQDTAGYRIHPCKGEYFSVASTKSEMVSRLVYPPPLKDLKGLGIHVTKSMDGRIRLGPNAFYTEDEDYEVNLDHSEAFYRAAKEYLPFVEPSDIEPDMAGIRPKLQGPRDGIRDFVVKHEAGCGLPGLVNLVGIESPGLTSCLSLAALVASIVEEGL